VLCTIRHGATARSTARAARRGRAQESQAGADRYPGDHHHQRPHGGIETQRAATAAAWLAPLPRLFPGIPDGDETVRERQRRFGA